MHTCIFCFLKGISNPSQGVSPILNTNLVHCRRCRRISAQPGDHAPTTADRPRFIQGLLADLLSTVPGDPEPYRLLSSPVRPGARSDETVLIMDHSRFPDLRLQMSWSPYKRTSGDTASRAGARSYKRDAFTAPDLGGQDPSVWSSRLDVLDGAARKLIAFGLAFREPRLDGAKRWLVFSNERPLRRDGLCLDMRCYLTWQVQ